MLVFLSLYLVWYLDHVDPQCDEDDLWGFAPEPQFSSLPPLASSISASRQDLQIESSSKITSLPWPFNFMDRTVELAIKELSVDSSRDDAIQVTIFFSSS